MPHVRWCTSESAHIYKLTLLLEFEQAYERWIGYLPDQYIGLTLYIWREHLGRDVKATVYERIDNGVEEKSFRTIDEFGTVEAFTKAELGEYHGYYGGVAASGGGDGYPREQRRTKRTRSFTPPPLTRREKADEDVKKALKAEASKVARAVKAARVVKEVDEARLARAPSVAGGAPVARESFAPSPRSAFVVHRPRALVPAPPKAQEACATQGELDAVVAVHREDPMDQARIDALVATFNRGH